MTSQSSQVGSQGKNPSVEDHQAMVNDTVIYILSQDHTKYTIKRQDIVKNCLKNFGKAYKVVMDDVKVALKSVFGMQLVEVEHTTNTYILINTLEHSEHVQDLQWSEEKQAQQILLMLALSHIFMSGGFVREDSMWNFLSSLHILRGNQVHEYFGDVRKLMTHEFVRQLYIEYCRIPESDPPKHEFRWGQRAEEEVSHREILKFVTDIHNVKDIEAWTTQYTEVTKKESKRGESYAGSGGHMSE